MIQIYSNSFKDPKKILAQNYGNLFAHKFVEFYISNFRLIHKFLSLYYTQSLLIFTIKILHQNLMRSDSDSD